MIYLLILFVVAVALAPLSHFVPSKRQRKIARLREYAAVHGLFVEFRKLPGAGEPGRAAVHGDVIYYGRRMPPRRGEAVKTASWLRDSVGWRGLDRRQEVPGVLLQLPVGILAAGVDGATCGVYWQESGEEQDVEQIQQVLEAWSGELLQ